MAYDKKTAYAKYLKSGLCGDCAKGCEGCSESTTESSSCDCCPPGLVSLKDAQGNHISCVTPNDYQEFITNVPPVCAQGYIALYDKNVDPIRFVGCVPSSEFTALNESLNPVA